MTRLKIGTLAIVLTAMAISATGCGDPKQVRINELQAALDDKDRQVGDMRSNLAQDEKTIGDLREEISSKDAEIARLGGSKPGTPVAQPAAGGAKDWEIGLIGDRVTLESDVLFAAGQASLTAAGKSRLDKIADDLKRKYGGMPVLVYGYTDTDPIRKTKDLWTDNLDLSSNRAAAVTRYLIGKGVKPALIDTVGRGEWHPLASGKAKSRRVEIVVVKTAAPGAK